MKSINIEIPEHVEKYYHYSIELTSKIYSDNLPERHKNMLKDKFSLRLRLYPKNYKDVYEKGYGRYPEFYGYGDSQNLREAIQEAYEHAQEKTILAVSEDLKNLKHLFETDQELEEEPIVNNSTGQVQLFRGVFNGSMGY